MSASFCLCVLVNEADPSLEPSDLIALFALSAGKMSQVLARRGWLSRAAWNLDGRNAGGRSGPPGLACAKNCRVWCKLQPWFQSWRQSVFLFPALDVQMTCTWVLVGETHIIYDVIVWCISSVGIQNQACNPPGFPSLAWPWGTCHSRRAPQLCLHRAATLPREMYSTYHSALQVWISPMLLLYSSNVLLVWLIELRARSFTLALCLKKVLIKVYFCRNLWNTWSCKCGNCRDWGYSIIIALTHVYLAHCSWRVWLICTLGNLICTWLCNNLTLQTVFVVCSKVLEWDELGRSLLLILILSDLPYVQLWTYLEPCAQCACTVTSWFRQRWVPVQACIPTTIITWIESCMHGSDWRIKVWLAKRRRLGFMVSNPALSTWSTFPTCLSPS